MNKVFVYGTLIPKGKEATHLISGYAMYNAGPYPYIRPADDSLDYAHVEGAIIEVTDKQLKDLDRYEGIDRGLYTRERVTVASLDSLEHEDVYVYVGTDQWPTLIPDGNWLNREANGTQRIPNSS